MINVLVTGSSGQLASCIKKLSSNHHELNLTFFDSTELDLSKEASIYNCFEGRNYDFCINCAAYTAVDQAEVESQKAFAVNAKGAQILAKVCHLFKVKLIHVSTDFVFDGRKGFPYLETDSTNPLGVYGQSKLEGEEHIKSEMDNYFIIRTSWLYSEFGKNFVKTMLRLGREKSSLNIVNDQIGSPTYAMDLAEVLMTIVCRNSEDYGVYHYSNQGEISWFDFAVKIFEFSDFHLDLKPVKTEAYKTPAKRPLYSVLNTDKVQKHLNVPIYNWEERLQVVINELI